MFTFALIVNEICMKRILLAALCVVLFASCSTLRMTGPRDGSVYDRKIPMAIMPYHDETISGAGELVHQLQVNGYKLISFESARTGRIPARGKHPRRGRIDMGNSFYILEVHTRKKRGEDDTYSSFRATLSDSHTGYIILSASLNGKKDARQTAREFVRKMNQTLR